METTHGHSSNVVYLAESELAVPEPTDEGYVELRLEMPDFAKDWSDEQSAGMCVSLIWSLDLFKGNSDAPCPHKAIWGREGEGEVYGWDDAGC